MGNLTIGFALTGSYCTFKKVLPQIEKIKNSGYEVLPVVSENAAKTDTRFGDSSFFLKEIEKISGNKNDSKEKNMKDYQAIIVKNEKIAENIHAITFD